jgi:hypothetical protein
MKKSTKSPLIALALVLLYFATVLLILHPPR